MKVRNFRAALCSLCFLSLGGHGLIFAAHPTARLELVASGLDSVTSIQNAGDGSGRLFVNEIFGRVRVIRDGQLLDKPFLDISDRVVQEGEGGLLGLAFHPRFAENRRFFVLYTGQIGSAAIWTLSEFRASANDPDIAVDEERFILRMGRPTAIHHAGDLAFGPDGYLYISSGDGGPVGDPNMRGQDLNSLLGKILRIGVDGPDVPYTVPPDNPFAGQMGRRGEIWAYGFRNPFRMAFDRLTGRLFVGDVGDTRIEEVNLVVKGGNFGWSVLEGSLCFPIGTDECERQGKTAAIHEYGREDGRAVIGGRVYRGKQRTPHYGDYIFADFVSGRIWALEEAFSGVWRRHDVTRAPFLLPAFGEDEQGELYVADILGGDLYRLDFGYQEIFAQVADGSSPAGTLSSVIQLINNQDQPASGVLTFRDSVGTPTDLVVGEETASQFAFTLPARSSRSWVTSGNSDPLFSGWAEVLSDVPVTGSVVFTFQEPDGGRAHRAGVSGSLRGQSFTAPVTITTLNADVGVSVVNPSPTDAAQLRVLVADQQGQVVVDFEFGLGPHQHGAQFVSEVGNLPEDFQGTLRLLSDRDIAPTLLLTERGLPSASLQPGN